MTRIEHLHAELARIEQRVDQLNTLLRHPNFDKLLAVEGQLLWQQYEAMVCLSRILRARFDLAVRAGNPDILELRELGLQSWLTI